MPKISLNAETFTVPLDKLERDNANVRQTDRETDVAALADNIAVEEQRDLLQHLRDIGPQVREAVRAAVERVRAHREREAEKATNVRRRGRRL